MQTAISPVIVYPGNANTLMIRSIGFGPPPSYYYELQQVTVTPAIDEQRDLITEALADLGDRNAGVFGHVVKERSREGRRVEAERCENERRLGWMRHVGLARRS